MHWLSRLAAVLFVVALPVLLVTSNVRFLAGEVRLYERGFREHDSATRTGLPLVELDRAAQEIINYFEDDAKTLRIVVNDDGEEVSLFNARETRHMEDVKSLMRFVFRLNEASLAYVLTYVAAVFLWSGSGSLRRLAVLALAGIGVGVVVVGVIGGFALAGFDDTWTKFHEIVFNNDFWRLNPDRDRLIQMFPEPFWAETTLILALMTLAEAAAVVLASLACLVFVRPRSLTPPATPPSPAVEPAPIRPPRTSVVE